MLGDVLVSAGDRDSLTGNAQCRAGCVRRVVAGSVYGLRSTMSPAAAKVVTSQSDMIFMTIDFSMQYLGVELGEFDVSNAWGANKF